MGDTPGLRLDDFGTTPSIRSDRTALLERLQEAARTQSTLHCVYFGGSKAGVARDIIPIKIDPPDVWAHCISSGRRKRFRLGLIYVLSPGEDPRWARPLEDRSVAIPAPDPASARNVKTLSQILQDYGDSLDALGWRVALSDKAIALHRITDDTGGAVVTLRQDDNGHWTVEGRDKRRIKRRRLGAAATLFLAAAEKHARSAAPMSRGRAARSGVWALLQFVCAAVLALALGLTIGVLLPH